MTYADELRKLRDKSENKGYSLEQVEQIRRDQIRRDTIKRHINECIDTGLNAVKKECSSCANNGQSGISGYLDIYIDNEYSRSVRGSFLMDKYKCKNKWCRYREYVPDFDFGMGEYAKSRQEQKEIAEEVREGIYNGLYECGFAELSVDTIKMRKKGHRYSYSDSKSYSSYIIYTIHVITTW